MSEPNDVSGPAVKRLDPPLPEDDDVLLTEADLGLSLEVGKALLGAVHAMPANLVPGARWDRAVACTLARLLLSLGDNMLINPAEFLDAVQTIRARACFARAERKRRAH